MEKQNIAERFKRMIQCVWRDVCNLRWALLGIAGYFVLVHFLFGQFCPMMILFRFPCPGCGMTRAAWLVFTGNWAQAWKLQPPVFGWILLGILWGYDRYWRNEESAGLRRCLKVLLVVLLVMTLGLYVVRICMGFAAELL